MRVSLRAAVEQFDANQFSDLEYGISDEDAAKGLRDTFTSLGIEWDEDCIFYCGQLTTEADEAKRIERAKQYAAEQVIWREKNPESAAMTDIIEAQLDITRTDLYDRLVDDMLKPNPFFSMLLNGKS